MKMFLICASCIAIMTGEAKAAENRQMQVRHSAVVPSGPSIRVMLEKDANSVILEARGPYYVVRKENGKILSSGSTGKRFIAHALQDGLRWGEEYPDVYQIAVVPASSDTTMFVNGIQYKGSLSLYHRKGNRIAVINEVPIEDFIKSTLALKIDEQLDKEAMSALVIAERTQAFLRHLGGKFNERPWDISAKEAGYYGYAVTRQPEHIEETVDLTRFMVLESTKNDNSVLKEKVLDITKAVELAAKGYDAKKILTTSFPHTKLGIDIHPDEVAVR